MCKDCVEIIKDKTGIKSWAEVKKGLAYVSTYANKEGGHCICGHDIINEHTIEYKATGDQFIIGSSCICQLIPEKDDAVRKKCMYKWCKLCKKNVSRERFKKHCEGKKHTELENHIKKYKQCLKCECLLKKDDWRNKCKDCYMFDKYGTKQCSRCLKYNIKADTNYKYCYKCK